MNEDPGTGQELDMQSASAIMQEASARAGRALVVRRPVLFAVWGAAWLAADGAIWLSVRGQRPYSGPTPAALMELVGIVAAAAIVTVILVGRAASGVGGLSALHRRILLMSYLAGFAGVLILEAALDHAGASPGVIGVYGAAAPTLLAGVVIAASSALRQDWSVLGLGLWLVTVGAGAGFAGPAAVWGVTALAGGMALLLMAGVGLRLRRS
jgi:hypothetical protein